MSARPRVASDVVAAPWSDPFGRKAHWAHSLSPAMRDRLRELHRLQHWRRLKIPAIVGFWFVLATLALRSDSLLVRVPCWILIGFCLNALGEFMHEGAHHNLFRIPILDRTIGFACGVPVLISCSNYRATHLLHHRYVSTPADPDNFAAKFPNRLVRRIAYYGFYLIGMPIYAAQLLITGPARAEGRRERMLCVFESPLLVGICATLAWAAPRLGLTKVVLVGWVAGLAVASVIGNVKSLAEHTLLEQHSPPDPLLATRTTPSGALVRFFFNQQNYHLEHHLFPYVPWYNLPAVHRLLDPILRSGGAPVCPTYFEYVSNAFRYGPLRNVRYAPGGKTIVS